MAFRNVGMFAFGQALTTVPITAYLPSVSNFQLLSVQTLNNLSENIFFY